MIYNNNLHGLFIANVSYHVLSMKQYLTQKWLTQSMIRFRLILNDTVTIFMFIIKV